MNRQRRWLQCALILMLASSASCGDDEGSGRSGASDSGTANVDAGGTRGGQDAEGGGGSSATGVPCGDMTCIDLLGGAALPIPIPIALPRACCLDEGTSTCGMSSMDGSCMPAPPAAVPDARCPGIRAFGLEVAGCCTQDGQCGVDGAMLGAGCVEDAAAAEQLSGLGMLLTVPKPRPCDSDTDAGTEDGGA